MRLLVNQHLYHLEHFLPADAEIDRFDPARFPTHAVEYDALFINTTTKINEHTLPDAGRLTFIGTGSAGTDHLDEAHLQQLGVRGASAPGCNAQSVAEYVLIAMLLAAPRPLPRMKVGIIGAGHTGQATQAILQKMGVESVFYDPPRATQDKAFQSASLYDLHQCDLLTVHTPLTVDPPSPTFHMIDGDFLAESRAEVLVQASRGGVVDERAVLFGLKSGRLRAVVTDVWEGEPFFSDELARHSLVATPHIAGYSVESKLRASKMIADAWRRHAGLPPGPEVAEVQEMVEVQDVAEVEKVTEVEKVIDVFHRTSGDGSFSPNAYPITDSPLLGSETARLVAELHPILLYDAGLRKLVGRPADEKQKGFYRLRTETPYRREFSEEDWRRIRAVVMGEEG